MKKYFRFHAGSLDASMKTQVEVENIRDIEKVIYENPCFPKEKCLFLYIDEEPIKDERIAAYGWGDTEYKVFLTMDDGRGRRCIGFTNFRKSSFVDRLPHFTSQRDVDWEAVEELRKDREKAWEKIFDGLTPEKIEIFCKIPMPSCGKEVLKLLQNKKIEKHEHYVNIYKKGNSRMIYTTLFDSYDDAYDYALAHPSEDPDVKYITTEKLEWEE